MAGACSPSGVLRVLRTHGVLRVPPAGPSRCMPSASTLDRERPGFITDIKHKYPCVLGVLGGAVRAQGGSDVRANTTRATPVDASKSGARTRARYSRARSRTDARARIRTHARRCAQTRTNMRTYTRSLAHTCALEETRTCARARTRRRAKHRQGRATSVRAVHPCECSEHPMCEYSEYPFAGPGDEFTLVGHKWFTSAPMSDAFLTLAHVPDRCPATE